MTPFACVNTLQNLCWWFLNPIRGVITLVIAIDRLFSVIFPLKYFVWGTKYAWLMVSLPVVVAVPFFTVLEIETYNMGEQYIVSEESQVSALINCRKIYVV